MGEDDLVRTYEKLANYKCNNIIELTLLSRQSTKSHNRCQMEHPSAYVWGPLPPELMCIGFTRYVAGGAMVANEATFSNFVIVAIGIQSW